MHTSKHEGLPFQAGSTEGAEKMSDFIKPAIAVVSEIIADDYYGDVRLNPIQLGHQVLDALVAAGYLRVEFPNDSEDLPPSCWVRPLATGIDH
jgi:hypothetical protein